MNLESSFYELIKQRYRFPQEGFNVSNGWLYFHEVNLSELIGQYGTPLKFTYLPLISKNIQKAKRWFECAIEKNAYGGKHHYCYCTKASHFKPILDEVLKNHIHIETSSAPDIEIINILRREGKITRDSCIICNGFKEEKYINAIVDLLNKKQNCIPIVDNIEEFDTLNNKIHFPFFCGIRVATEKPPDFEFYTGRLGINPVDIVPLCKRNDDLNARIKMLHLFIDSGISDTLYYWDELTKCLDIYAELKKICPYLDSFNIGGGIPIKDCLSFNYDYEYMIDKIIRTIKSYCTSRGVEVPDIFTEFGNFTVGESGGIIYKVISQKIQNDREKWNMINSSLMNTLPDTWGIKKRFIMLPVNGWDYEYEKVFLGGLTCDGDDYYNSVQSSDMTYMPKLKIAKDLYVGLFNTGAYQDSVGGVGGLQHCLIPCPKHILITKDEDSNLKTKLFREQQSTKEFLRILGYEI